MLLWHNGGPPWFELQKPDPLARFLSIFITWALLRFLQGTVFTGHISQGAWSIDTNPFGRFGLRLHSQIQLLLFFLLVLSVLSRDIRTIFCISVLSEPILSRHKIPSAKWSPGSPSVQECWLYGMEVNHGGINVVSDVDCYSCLLESCILRFDEQYWCIHFRCFQNCVLVPIILMQDCLMWEVSIALSQRTRN